MMHPEATHGQTPINAATGSASNAQQQFASNICWAVLVLACIALMPSGAYAADNPLTITLCRVISWFTGDLGKAIATLGVIVLAIGALMGKVAWSLAIIVSVGISIMFSGANVVNMLTGQTVSCPADASGGNAYALSETLCNLAGLANSATGRGLATLAVCLLGIATLFGKVSYQMAIIVSMGVGIILNAHQVASLVEPKAGGFTTAACSPLATPG